MSALNPNSAITASSSPATSSNNPSAPPPVFAAFSPTSSSQTTKHHARTTLLVHQKSPLLVATPPQITRALAYFHPFISPLSKLAGLLSWSTNDPWESFLLVCAFWAIVLYGDVVIRTTGPLLLGAALILGMYSRRFSPLSSTGWATPQPQPSTSTTDGEKESQKRPGKETHGSTAHHKSLDEIVATMQTFTTRCNILIDPFLTLTDFLSTTHTATTATTRPALTALFTRLLIIAPIWWALTLSPVRLITTRRVVLTIGTLALSWHSRPARVSRVILWRSKSVRRVCSLITGLSFPTSAVQGSAAQDADKKAAAATANLAKNGGKQREGIRFTFALYENQRRWLGIGWTHSMLAYERAPWTDEYLNPSPPKDSFTLPDVPGGMAKWRWTEESEWEVSDDSSKPERDAAARKRATSEGKKGAPANGSKASPSDEPEDDRGWIYYDNKWQNGRRGIDGWGRYTRRRKWVRNAELVEKTPSMDTTPTASPTPRAATDDKTALPRLDSHGALLTPENAAGGNTNLVALPPEQPSRHTRASDSLDSTSSTGSAVEKEQRGHSWFRRRKQHSRSNSQTPSAVSTTGGASGTSPARSTTREAESDDTASEATKTTDRDEDEGYVPLRQAPWERAWGMGLGDEGAMDLG